MVKGDKKNKREYERKKAQEDEAKASKRREDLEIKKEKGKSNPIPSDHGSVAFFLRILCELYLGKTHIKKKWFLVVGTRTNKGVGMENHSDL